MCYLIIRRSSLIFGGFLLLVSTISPLNLSARDKPVGSKTGAKPEIVCDLGAIPTQTLRRFWTAESRSASQLEFLAVYMHRKNNPAEATREVSLNVDTMLGGLTTSTADFEENGEILKRDAGHILANLDKANCDLSTQRKDNQGQLKFVTVNGKSIPDCTVYYLGKDKNSIGGVGKGGDPNVDGIDSPFLQYYECYKWDGKAYVYDWTALERRLDAALTVGPISYFIPGIPWAFQRGMTFCHKDNKQAIRPIPNGWFRYTGTIYPDIMRETRYGNEMVPDRIEEYGKFLEAAVRHLSTSPKYKDQVSKWSWKIGQEIDTRAYTLDRYFKLYEVSLRAILKVLPNARIGVHIGVAHERGWIPPFLEYCKKKNLKCDFVGISRYRSLNNPNTNPDEIDDWLNSLVSKSEWRSSTALEIHEFGIDAGPTAADKVVQKMPYYALFASHLLQNKFFKEWFKGAYESSACLEWMETVLDQPIYKCSSMGKTKAKNGWVGAILTRDQTQGAISVLIFNYNANSSESGVENVVLRLSNMPKSASKNYGIESQFYRSDKLMETKQLQPTTEAKGSLNLEIPVVANSIVTLKIQ